MKDLLLLRHGKSSWDDPSLSDHDRPLKRRGLRDAPRMGRLLVARSMLPDRIVTSTAVRAATTARLAAEESGFDGDVVESPDLYMASVTGILGVARETPEPVERLMLVGHNPGLEDCVAMLSGGWEKFPTAALARFRLDVDSWSELDARTPAEMVGLWRPKELDDEL